jgi:hypothetical protein
MRTLLLLSVLAVAGLLACAPPGGGTDDDALLAVGSMAPDVTLQRLDGPSYPLSSLRGKTVLLNFWFRH